MCYRIRQEQTEHQVAGTALTPPSTDRLRPRLVGAAAVMLAAGLAAAALVMPPSMQPAPTATTHQSAPPTLPLADKTTPSGTQEQAPVNPGVIEQISISGDDSVPTNSDLAKTAAGGCAHEL
jgi:hypothetical protein